ncbi:Coenzyme Q-binding protein coq10, mitochondrial [Fulvia fulva]|uniref:Coenzyme Q-binding protein coq10, mitochondrial n=1 Tax=Passalora fulva TaxID=5499 RepID=A0A9Q8P8P7_PASFU|nr:Coenzyme Q-binding protein coq10, mitochondrial [Fulvia fulva]KAK4615883.1 Coenzyme Q-binding protein coq10, mitochondrial [Fulvia fulva]KAK4616449.1 Coenzyme Q-binding protein coq10, mitochondrial [Fulvia fulva]UJO17116.1 Coenzyme Q-binding protein coq10, mitochondrial [Fulvia fulva]WPV19353.1 Coenzyme Q-binding protein coq10, mitochondrial [Fulvia fulva]WPV34644.1 Coenzyme Q-binding protein coq10, mitochondrial [Fulvia fulva]
MKSIKPISSISSGLLPSALRQPTTCRAAFLANTSTRSTNHDRQAQHRTFVSNPFTQNQILTASRTLPYPSSLIYSIISDVSSYNQFVPYCQRSEVTKWSEPASDGKRYPEVAQLVIGFNDSISESFTSRLYCVPERIIEAVSGSSTGTLEKSPDAKHHSPRPSSDQDASRQNTVMSHLLTRWSLRPYPYKPPPTGAVHKEGVHKNHEETSPIPGQERTEVNLVVEYKFANPVYDALASTAANKVAEKMIEAFESRVRMVMEGPGTVKPNKQS